MTSGPTTTLGTASRRRLRGARARSRASGRPCPRGEGRPSACAPGPARPRPLPPRRRPGTSGAPRAARAPGADRRHAPGAAGAGGEVRARHELAIRHPRSASGRADRPRAPPRSTSSTPRVRLRRNGSGSGSVGGGRPLRCEELREFERVGGRGGGAGGARGRRCHGCQSRQGGCLRKVQHTAIHRKNRDARLWRTSHRLVMIALLSLSALGSLLRRPRGSARLRMGGRARRARHRGRAPAAVAGRAARAARRCSSTASGTPLLPRSSSPTAPCWRPRSPGSAPTGWRSSRRACGRAGRAVRIDRRDRDAARRPAAQRAPRGRAIRARRSHDAGVRPARSRAPAGRGHRPPRARVGCSPARSIAPARITSISHCTSPDRRAVRTR